MAPTTSGAAKKAPPKPAAKQASLFSFFAKKDKVISTPESAPAPQASPSASSAPAAIHTSARGENVTPGNPSMSPENAQQGSSGPDKAVTTFGAEVVGRRVGIFWPEDDEYYSGTVSGFNSQDGKHSVLYDDGEEERVMLANETLRWEEGKGPTAPPAASAKRDAEAAAESSDEEEGPSAPRKRRSVVLDDEESECEMDLDGLTATPAAHKAALQQGGLKRKDGATPGGAADADSSVSSAGKWTRLDAETPMHQSSDRSRGSSSAKSAAVTPAPRPRSNTPLAKLFTPSTPASASSKASKATPSASTPMDIDNVATPSASELPEGTFEPGKHLHNRLKWVTEDRRDANKKKPTDPDYDPRTLYVPPDFLRNETPAMRQWWEFKSRNFDTLLFFKVGKFYEIFHHDADIAVKELDLIYMKGEKAHSGFPESAFAKFASILVDRGYRVARVEQTETPEMMKEHNRTASKSAKRTVVQRELCSVMSKGTRTFCYLDESLDEGDPVGPLMIGIKERVLEPQDEDDEARVMYGICMVDPNTGAFRLGQFEDDQQRCRLRTMLTQFAPAEVLLEKGVASHALEQMVRFYAPGAVLEHLKAEQEFWTAEQTLKKLKQGGYFPKGSKHADGATEDDPTKGTSRWPQVLQLLVQGGAEGELAMSALGGVVWQLRRSLIEHDLLSMQTFFPYAPPDVPGQQGDDVAVAEDEDGAKADDQVREPLVLDGTTLSNLEIFRNNYDRGSKGSLWEYMNKCLSPFGARKFREWMCKPLRSLPAINARLDAVAELMDNLSAEADGFRSVLKKMPDLERQLARHHSLGSIHRSAEHPDSRAIMYEMKQYNARKIADFLSCLDGLKQAVRIKEMLDGSPPASPLLRKIARSFPDMREKLQFFADAFDPVKAKKESVITPRPGVDPEYDEAKEAIADITTELDTYLREQRKRLGCTEIVFWGNGKDRFQLEIPESVLKRHGGCPAEYESKSSKKGWKRFHTPRIKELLESLVEAEERLAEAQKDEMRRLFEKFDTSREVWSAAVQCMAMLDCLLSLARVSSGPEFCRPNLSDRAEPFITVKNGRHPCLAAAARNDSFIPNDVSLGEQCPRIMLLSGPNMGGKSTLLRQTCVLAIMAQMGCYVPAESLDMTPVDRIFTRVGASDRILQGQSTFFVELSETANILQHATPHSLVILDELGRGTSTFDGTAIAHAVVKYLVEQKQCRTLFATHYHSLVEDWRGSDRVCFGHMACMVEPDGDEQKVTFLYRLAEGPSPKSYGINVARLAHLPREVIQVAKLKSEMFETSMAQAEGVDRLLELGAEVLASLQAGGADADTLAGLKTLWSSWNM